MLRLCTRSLLALLLVPGLAIAQGDECTDPLPVTVGTYGPFITGNASTSFPWPCASGGNDIWFVAVCNAIGTATFDTCASNFDTCIEVFDGSGGCGNLVSLGCDDSSCSPQASLTVTAAPGLLLLVRVGGWNGSTGTVMLDVTGDVGPATGFATAARYGSGCYDNRASFYELTQDPANFDLSNTSFTMLPNTGGGYTILPGLSGFVTPSASAILVTLGDDSSSTLALTTPFPVGGTTTPNLEMYSNGFVSTAPGNATIGTIVPANFFNEPNAAWRNWHDYDPSQGGQTTFEEVGPIAYFTWTNVPDWGVTGSSSTFQLQFDTSNGAVTFAFQQMSLTGGGGGGNGHMVGFSPAGMSLQPDPVDISVALPATFAIQNNDSFELTLAATDRPILGSSLALETGNVPTTATIGVQIFGLTQMNPGVDLASLGMAGCRQYLSTDASVVIVPTGSTATWPMTVVSSVAFAGVHIFAQSAMLVPGANAFGAVSSNGVDLRFDIN